MPIKRKKKERRSRRGGALVESGADGHKWMTRVLHWMRRSNWMWFQCFSYTKRLKSRRMESA